MSADHGLQAVQPIRLETIGVCRVMLQAPAIR
ncbi:hypothetical protein ABH979_003206 [Bradyrhizobium ottawaense]